MQVLNMEISPCLGAGLGAIPRLSLENGRVESCLHSLRLGLKFSPKLGRLELKLLQPKGWAWAFSPHLAVELALEFGDFSKFGKIGKLSGAFPALNMLCPGSEVSPTSGVEFEGLRGNLSMLNTWRPGTE